MNSMLVRTAYAVVAMQVAAVAQIQWVHRTPATSPSPRYAHSMAYDSQRGRTVLFGGYTSVTSGIDLGDTWEWDGTDWVQVSTTGPAPRSFAAMAYDSQRGKTVLFGGSGTGMTDTWEWDGSSWLQVPDAGPPHTPTRAMAYDSVRHKLVLYLGYQNGQPNTGQAWEWSGTTWTQVGGALSPGGNATPSMAFDSRLGRCVLVGGWTSANLTDTWEWDGSIWTAATTGVPGPGLRSGCAMVFDSQRALSVLFGGTMSGSTYYYGDVWTWNGIAWTQPSASSPSPAGRAVPGMSYDSQRRTTVMFGGATLSGVLADTWEIVAPTVALTSAFGSGCGAPPISITPQAGARPVLGATQISNIANAYLGLAFVAWGTTQQSIDLDFAGFAGCMLWHGAEGEIAAGCTQTSWNTAQHSLFIPVDPLLVGVHIYLQAWTLAPGYNPIGLATSNGVELLIGDV